MNVLLLAVPAIVILLGLVSLARQLPWMESGLKPARVAGSPRAARGVALRAAVSSESESECQTPWFSGADPAPRVSGSSSAARQEFDPLSRENMARICSKFRIREISLLPPKRSARAHVNVGILVEFQPDAAADNTVVFRLRQELFQLVGRQVDLVCKNSAEFDAQRKLIAKARVLYAA